jgi:hypothetical protein
MVPTYAALKGEVTRMGENVLHADRRVTGTRVRSTHTARAGGIRPAGVPVLTTKVALELPTGLTFHEWERTGRQLAGVLSSSSWWLGDWLIYGKDHYSDRYEIGIRAAGLQYQTLRNYAWVAGRFPPARRRPTLSFQHHAELAPFGVEEQDEWLRMTEERGWTIRQLRGAIRAARTGTIHPGQAAENLRRVAVPTERFERWHEAAALAGKDVEQWMLAILDDAAEQQLET